MPRPKIPKFLAWSFSRWKAYDECPARARWTHLDKIGPPDDQKSPALMRGSEIHEEAKLYVQGHYPAGKLPKSLELFDREFAILKEAYQSEDVIVEEQWALDGRWQPTEWFAPDAWLRVVLDAAIFDWKARRAIIIDHKTGKIRSQEQEPQLELYAAAALSRLEGIDEVVSTLWYLDHGKTARKTYDRTQLSGLKKSWERRTKKMLADERFDPKPSDACRHCPFSKARSGPCRY